MPQNLLLTKLSIVNESGAFKVQDIRESGAHSFLQHFVIGLKLALIFDPNITDFLNELRLTTRTLVVTLMTEK